MRFAVLAVLLSATSLLRAQIDNGNITGRVTDPTGAAVVGAQVTVIQTATNSETIAATNEEGLCRALNVRPGPYRVTVVAQGFKRLIRDSIDLRVGPNANLSSRNLGITSTSASMRQMQFAAEIFVLTALANS